MKLLPSIVGDFRYREPKTGGWKFVLEADLTIRFPKDFWGSHEFADKDGRPWVTTEARDWTISEGYAWDGASFAINFEETLAASAWHDSSGQFRHLRCISKDLTGKIWNDRFADIITAQGAPKIAAVYWFGLFIGNPFYSGIGKLIGNRQTGRCLNHKTV